LASPIEQAGGITTLMLSAGDTSVMMETSLCGRGMAANLAACMAFGVLLGHPLHAIAEKLASLRAIPGRSQRLIDFGKATVVLEAGGAPDRLREALCTAKHAGVGGRVWCVLAVGDREGAETLARYGRTMERFAHHCVVTSRPDQDGSFLNRSHHVLDGVKECAAIRLVADQEKAIRWAIEQAGPRDSVVIVTNRPAQTPYEDRCVWQQLEGIVAAAREQREPAPTPSSPGPEPGRTINLKLFGG
jgi:UDP-N-acetylmuramoyl-L-alanyl-D-glutamate--2,6-diaminopimelate ligase